MGMLLAFQFIGFTVFVLASGIVSDHIGKKTTLSAAMIMLTLSSFILSFVSSFELLCFVLLFLGGGMGILEMMSNALLSDIRSDNAVFYLNFMQVFFGLGAIIGPVLIGVAYASDISWRIIYRILGVLLAFLTVWFMVNKLPTLPPSEKVNISAIKNLFTDKKFILICLCMFLYTGAESSGWGWLSTYTSSILNFTVIESSTTVAVFWVSMTISRLLVALIIKKCEVRKIIMVMATFAGIVCGIMSFVQEGFAVWLMIVLLGFACSSQWGLILSYGTERYKRNSGTVFALLVASGGIGMSIVPYLSGIAGDLFGMRTSLFVPAVMFLLITLSFVVIPNVKARLENTLNM